MILSPKYYNYCTALVAAFPLLGIKAGVYAIILWCVYSLALYIKTRPGKPDRRDYINIVVLSSLYLAYIISFFFSEDKKEIGRFLERNISFLLFPLFMILNKRLLTKEALKLSLNSFIISNIVLCLYVWSYMLYSGIGRIFSDDQYYNPVIRNIFSDTTGIHLPYLGMLFTFASVLLLQDLFTQKTRTALVIAKVAGIALLIGSTAVFMARISLFTFLLVALFFSFKLLKSKKHIVLTSLAIVAAITAFLLLPSSQRRIKEGLAAKYELPYEGQPSELVNFRYGIYNCVATILKDNWLMGVGPANVQEELDKCYEQYTYSASDDYKHITYNAHSQYLDIWLKFGVAGLVLFVIFLLWGIKNRHKAYQGFIIIILIALLTENMFARQIGVVFFTFFNTLFFVLKKDGDRENNRVLKEPHPGMRIL